MSKLDFENIKIGDIIRTKDTYFIVRTIKVINPQQERRFQVSELNETRDVGFLIFQSEVISIHTKETNPEFFL